MEDTSFNTGNLTVGDMETIGKEIAKLGNGGTVRIHVVGNGELYIQNITPLYVHNIIKAMHKAGFSLSRVQNKTAPAD